MDFLVNFHHTVLGWLVVEFNCFMTPFSPNPSFNLDLMLICFEVHDTELASTCLNLCVLAKLLALLLGYLNYDVITVGM